MPLIPDQPYSASDIPDYPQCTPHPIRIIHVGGGASGILFAHKIERWLTNFELLILEKNSSLGGTWYENRYPGCACDIPAHSYVFPFEPNPEWSGYYSYSDEIHEYMMKCAKKWEVDRYVKLKREVVSATWDEARRKWTVETRVSDGEKQGETEWEECDVLINGAGVVNKWKWPAIEGLHSFGGALAHSANWDQKLDWKGKRVAVIGTGSSSIQMVPRLAEGSTSLKVFMRNPTYIGPQIGSSVSNKQADPEAMEPGAAQVHRYTEKEKQKFRDDEDYLLDYRKRLEQAVVGGFKMFYRGSELNIQAKAMMQADMAAKLGDNDDLKKRLIPDWSPGCRRLTPGEGYLETLILPHVTTVHEEIVRVTPKGVVTADGTEHEVDILACATGFYTQFLPHFKITGIGGQVMQDSKEPNVYASIGSPGYPNYFIVNGPRGNWGQGCILPSHEVHVEYILQCCKRMQEDGVRSMQPKEQVTAQFNLYVDAWHKKHSIWAENCKSWYKNNDTEGRVWLWPGSMLHFLKFMKRPRFEHYDLEYRDPTNIFALLGGGITIAENKNKPGQVPVPYIRLREEDPWELE